MGSLVIHLCAGGQSPCADFNKLWRSIMCEEKQSCLAAAHRPCSSPPFFPVWKLLKNDIASPGSWIIVGRWANQWVTDVSTCRVCSLIEYDAFILSFEGKKRCAEGKFEFNHENSINSSQNSKKLKPLPLFTDITNIMKNFFFFLNYSLSLLIGGQVLSFHLGVLSVSHPVCPLPLFCWAVSYFALFEWLPSQRKDVKGRQGKFKEKVFILKHLLVKSYSWRRDNRRGLFRILDII